ncbi:hypothetical protein X777_13781 [Ooceraea biroi]|uniref:Reverse transcriptase zinc-binding domain-containing protein n=1 Tax=Ooceraea biroi TaxID=2015173 RepID=A0A026VXR7_OOCBI|nr:hypothetical protein X777_13781 [Ooceraea biroi]
MAVPKCVLCASFGPLRKRRRFDFYRDVTKAALTGLHYFTHYHLAERYPWYYHKQLNRQTIVLLNRLRSNHYNLNYSLFRKNIVSSGGCTCGNPRQDMNHVILYCPLYRDRALFLITFIQSQYHRIFNDITPLLHDPPVFVAFFKSVQLFP